MIGRPHHTIVDCPDPAALAAFYAELLGLPITYADPTFVVVSVDDTTSGIAFQLAPDHAPPAWPNPERAALKAPQSGAEVFAYAQAARRDDKLIPRVASYGLVLVAALLPQTPVVNGVGGILTHVCPGRQKRNPPRCSSRLARSAQV
jgi:catechol 2,3-dioxygenase-like lactoylglutathione lyase family enzyme